MRKNSKITKKNKLVSRRIHLKKSTKIKRRTQKKQKGGVRPVIEIISRILTGNFKNEEYIDFMEILRMCSIIVGNEHPEMDDEEITNDVIKLLIHDNEEANTNNENEVGIEDVKLFTFEKLQNLSFQRINIYNQNEGDQFRDDLFPEYMLTDEQLKNILLNLPSGLKILSIRDCNFSNFNAEDLETIFSNLPTQLEQLDLTGSYFKNDQLTNEQLKKLLGRVKKLKQLIMDECFLTTQQMESLIKLLRTTNVEELGLSIGGNIPHAYSRGFDSNTSIVYHFDRQKAVNVIFDVDILRYLSKKIIKLDLSGYDFDVKDMYILALTELCKRKTKASESLQIILAPYRDPRENNEHKLYLSTRNLVTLNKNFKINLQNKIRAVTSSRIHIGKTALELFCEYIPIKERVSYMELLNSCIIDPQEEHLRLIKIMNAILETLPPTDSDSRDGFAQVFIKNTMDGDTRMMVKMIKAYYWQPENPDLPTAFTRRISPQEGRLQYLNNESNDRFIDLLQSILRE